MKKHIFIFFVLFIVFKNLCSLELNEETKLEKIDTAIYNLGFSANYSNNTNHLILSLPLSSITPLNSNLKDKNNKFRGLFLFSKKGELLSKIGKFNSYEKGGIISVFNFDFLNHKIFISDSKRKKLLIFSDRKPFHFLNSYDFMRVENITDIPTLIYKDFVFFPTTSDQKFEFGKQGKAIVKIRDYKRTLLAQINTSPRNKIIIKNIKRINSYKEYFDLFWNDKRTRNNKWVKKLIKKMKKTFDTNFILNEFTFVNGIGPNIHKSKIILKNNNFFIIPSFGTEIKYYTLNGDSLDCYNISKFRNIRNAEIELYKEKMKKELKSEKNLKKFRDRYKLSILYNSFYDKKHNTIILQYFLENIFQKISNLPKSKFNSYLLVYSLDKRKAISDFIPIDFTPVAIDSEKRELIGVQQRDGDIYLQFYKWDY